MRAIHIAPRHRSAFTLVEAMVSIVVVGMILVAALTTLGATARVRHVAGAQSQGPELARQLMSEILGAAFVDPEDPTPALGTDPGEDGAPGSRALWDDVDDYDGLTENPVVYKDDEAVPDTIGWSRSVSVQYADPATLVDMGSTETSLKHVTVSARAPDGAITVLNALRSAGGAVEQPPPLDTSYVTWVGVELELRAAGGVVSSGVSLPNHAIGGPE